MSLLSGIVSEQIHCIELNDERWYIPGTNILHNENAPAIVGKDCHIWFNNGVRHRLDGPSGIWFDDEGEWYLREWVVNNLLHRLNGPAVEYRSGNNNEYRVNGLRLSEEEFYKQYPQYEILEVF